MDRWSNAWSLSLKARQLVHNPGGEFLFTGVPEGGPYELWIDSGVHLPFRAKIHVTPSMAPFEVTLQSGCVLSGRLVEEATGAAVGDAWVKTTAGDLCRQTRSDHDGNFAVRGLEARDVELRVIHPAYLALVRPVSIAGETLLGDLPLAPAAQLEVLVGEPPAAGIRVQLEDPAGIRYHGSFIASGRFRFDGLPAATYRVWIHGEGFAPYEAQSVQVAAGAGMTHQVRFAAAPDAPARSVR
jgi:hypothetical protein